ncbi:hypothetical protein H0H10_13910 [Streptomyces sp. TRM S81-3]|uniref:Uncharacterized protein n=1 Tax=Streptomyces griseicoloratus TaxID=2752516 RepID=A0A926L0I0_9ACTN|nr:hypothetical protein [Streptomyces griseicoloratus]MBD0420242.1 hypothetical protein [Streptomyces griseicoloratus]
MLTDVDESGALAFAEVVTAALLDAPEPRRTCRPGVAAALLPRKGRTSQDPRD